MDAQQSPIEALDEDTLMMVLTQLSGLHLAVVARVSRGLKAAAYRDELWQRLLRHAFWDASCHVSGAPAIRWTETEHV